MKTSKFVGDGLGPPITVYRGSNEEFVDRLSPVNFEDWRWLGSLDTDEELFKKLVGCIQGKNLCVGVGTDDVDIFVRGELNDTSIAYGMFCILQKEFCEP